MPLSSHAKPADSFALASELEAELQKVVKGEVRFDRGSRALYATDASNYRQIPIGLVVPRDAEDVIATVAVCKKFGAPVLPRGAGTSLAGQCCNVAVVLDFTKNMHRILEIDSAAGWARVQPLSTVVKRRETRSPAEDLTVFKALGMGISDLALGIELYRKAVSSNLGRAFDHPKKMPPRLHSYPGAQHATD